MKKLLTALFITLSHLTYSQCVGTENYTISPLPTNGGYVDGTVLTVCYEMVGWNGLSVNSNWVEGFDINLSQSLTPPIPQAPPTNCDGGSGSWIWISNTVTSSYTGLSAGPGWFFETNSGGPIDGNPGNDWGDFGSCTWEFCFTTTVIGNCLPEDITIDVTVGADGTWGSWSQGGCGTLPFSVFNGTTTPPDFESVNTTPLVEIVCVGETTQHIVLDTTLSSTFNPNDSILVTWISPGIQQLSIIEENSVGCLDTTIFTVDVKPLPVVNIVPVDTLCSYDNPVNITATPIGGIWNITTPLFDPQLGTTWVRYSYEDEFGCYDVDSTLITVITNPEPTNIIGNESFVICSDEDRNLFYYTENNVGSQYVWILNGDTLENNENIVDIVFPDVVDMNNYLEVYEINEYGCVGYPTDLLVTSKGCGNIFIPNTFTPDGDNVNDIFKVTTDSKIEGFEMMIFDRWGLLIFEFQNQKDGWLGINCQIDTYVYNFKGKLNGKRVDRFGHVNLVR